MSDTNDQKEFIEATDAIGDAFVHLVAVAFTGSATLHEAVEKVEPVLNTMHWMLTRCIIEAAMNKKGE